MWPNLRLNPVLPGHLANTLSTTGVGGYLPGAPKKGNADGAEGIFWQCQTRVGFGSATGPTLCQICTLVERMIYTERGVFRLLSSCWVAFGHVCVARIWLGVLRHWRFPPASEAFTPYRGLGLLPGAWGAPNKWNADGAEGIFRNARLGIFCNARRGPTLKTVLCHTCPVVGRMTNTERGIFSPGDAWQETSLGVGLLKKIVTGKKEFIGRSYENCYFRLSIFY